MTTYVRAPEAARRLGITLPTLYAYVSRGRIGRTKAADGKASLFDLAEVEQLRSRSRRGPSEPPPTIDVQIASAITQLDEEALRYRGHRVEELLGLDFEQVAELLWTDTLPTDRPVWPIVDDDERRAAATTLPTSVDLVALAARLAAAGPADDSAPAAARRLLSTIPGAFGVPRRDDHGSFAGRVTRIWVDDPPAQLVTAVNAALVLLADHELATSTLAVRVAASVRSAPLLAIVAGLATVEGALHGSAAAHAHRFLDDAAARGPAVTIGELLDQRRRVPGFGHKIYRRRDPRFGLLVASIRSLPGAAERIALVDEVLRVAGARIAHHPNVDLALGALSYVAGLPPDTPLFAIARIAGWGAHYEEELAERPIRYRGLARSVVDAPDDR